jgi:four helix bundle protein
MRDFRTLRVWEKAHQLTLVVYKTTRNFPQNELYGLTSQMRRASASIPTNIAEGCGRETEAELARFMYIALGSASELEYQCLLAHDLNFLSDSVYQDLHNKATEVKRMLTAFIKKLKAES